MRLIGLAVFLVLTLALAPLATAAQAGKVWRIGVLASGVLPEWIEAFREGLRQLGYVAGQNITIEFRDAEGKTERLPLLATDLIRLQVDIIVTTGSDPTRAAQRATKTIPIVIALSGDPVGSGFVASLSRPGGNITGFTPVVEGLNAKRLQLLKEAIPKITRVGVLWRRTQPAHQSFLKEINGAAPSLGVQLHLSEARDPDELDSAFSAMAKARVGAVNVLGDTMFQSQRKRIVDLATRNRLPAVYPAKVFVEVGGLISYGPDQSDRGCPGPC